jgi:hypothetical protein
MSFNNCQFWTPSDIHTRCKVYYYNDMGHFMTTIIWDEKLKPSECDLANKWLNLKSHINEYVYNTAKVETREYTRVFPESNYIANHFEALKKEHHGEIDIKNWGKVLIDIIWDSYPKS